MQIKLVNIQEWNKLVRSLPSYTFFQLPIWAQVYERTYPKCEIATKMFIFDDGVQVLVPLVEMNSKFGFKSYASLPESAYGGFVWNTKPNEQQLHQILNNLLNMKTMLLGIYPNPLEWEEMQFLEKYGFKSLDNFTHILELDNPEVLYSNFTHACRKNIKRAEREDLRLVDGQFEDLSSYYKIYEDCCVNRWNIKKIDMKPLSFFQNLIEVGKEHVRLLFVEKEGVKIAGAIILYGKEESMQWSTASLHQYANLRPNNFWEWEVIKDSWRKGCKLHNFGASGGLVGVQRFKESFGAKKVNYKYFVYENPLLKVYRKVKLAMRLKKGRTPETAK